MRKHTSIFFSILAFILTSCNWHKDRLKVDVSGINIQQVKINRYDQDLFRIPLNDLRNGLAAIQTQYPFFLGTNFNDTSRLTNMRDYLISQRNIDFYRETEKKFRDLNEVERNLTEGFRHIEYYYPGTDFPRIYSYISGGDYENPVQLMDSVLIIALDTYLGSDFKPYLGDGLSLYKTQRMTPEHIVPGCMRSFVNRLVNSDMSVNTFLDQIIDAGKRLYLLDAFIPDIAGNLKINYTPEQYEWAVKNEKHVWAAIIENRMLYSTDAQTLRLFLADGPFTAAFGKESPPRLGEWIGWQIVRSYMNHQPEITVQDLMQKTDAQEILNQSGYKPEK